MKFFRIWLALLPLFFPLYLVRFEVGVPSLGAVPTTLLEVLVWMTAVLGIGIWAGYGFRGVWHRIWADGWSGPIGPVLLFLIAATFSMLLVPADSARIAQGIWKGWIVMPLVYFAMVYGARFTHREWTISKYALLGSGAAVALGALLQMATGEYRTWDGRASGPFESANYLSLYLGPLVVLGVHQAKRTFQKCPSLWGKVISMVLVGILAVALYGTKSYAAFIAVLAGLAVYLFFAEFSVKARWRLVLTGVGILALLLVTQWNSPKFQQFIDFEERSSSTVRLEVYRVAWAMIKEHPVAGIGLGQFEVQYALQAPKVLGHAPYEWVMLHPHNLALAFWLNTGLLGLMAMVWLVAGMVWRAFRAGPRKEARFLMLALLTVVVVHGLFDTPFFKNDLAYLWWWVVAFGV